MAANKTDANDADGLAHLAEVGFFREVRVKGFDSMLTRTLVAARTRLVRITTELSNQIRGLMKTFGLLVPAGKGSTFEKNVRRLLVDQEGLARIVLPILEAWRSMRVRAAELGRQLVAGARRSKACRILMSIPGIGAITGDFLCDRYQGSGELQEVKIGRRLAWPDDPALPVGRGRL
jgi:transposase